MAIILFNACARFPPTYLRCTQYLKAKFQAINLTSHLHHKKHIEYLMAHLEIRYYTQGQTCNPKLPKTSNYDAITAFILGKTNMILTMTAGD